MMSEKLCWKSDSNISSKNQVHCSNQRDGSSATGSQGQVISTLSVQHLVQFNLPNVPYGARLLEPQVGEFSWDRAPPEVVDDAGDKQPGKTNEG